MPKKKAASLRAQICELFPDFELAAALAITAAMIVATPPMIEPMRPSSLPLSATVAYPMIAEAATAKG